jgi:hypothetical protein
MKTPAPIPELAHQLAMIGIQVRPEHIPAFLGWAGVIGGAIIAGWFGVAKIRTDKQSMSMPELWALVRQQGADIDQLKRDMGALTSENRWLRDTVRDKDETLKDYAGHLQDLDEWELQGRSTPAPRRSWRIFEHMSEVAREAAQKTESEA